MLLSTGMTTASPFLSKGRGVIISYPTAATGLHLWLSLPCTPGLCLEAGTSHAKGCLSLHPSSGYAHSLIWLLHLGGAVWVMGSAPSFCRRGDTGSTPLTTVHLLLCPRAPVPSGLQPQQRSSFKVQNLSKLWIHAPDKATSPPTFPSPQVSIAVPALPPPSHSARWATRGAQPSPAVLQGLLSVARWHQYT